MRCTGHFVPPMERANLPPDSKWRQFASTLPYVVGPVVDLFSRRIFAVRSSRIVFICHVDPSTQSSVIVYSNSALVWQEFV